MFIHLHVHSNFSFYDGAAPLADLVEAAARLDMPALAVTDHNSLAGAVRFYQAARQAGIKPIIGVEFDIEPLAEWLLNDGLTTAGEASRLSPPASRLPTRVRLLLLALDNDGYSHLCRLVTCAHLGEARSAGPFAPQYQEVDRKHPLLRQEHLRQYASHLLAISPAGAGEIAVLLQAGAYRAAAQVARYYAALFGPGNFYIELQHHLHQPEGVRHPNPPSPAGRGGQGGEVPNPPSPQPRTQRGARGEGVGGEASERRGTSPRPTAFPPSPAGRGGQGGEARHHLARFAHSLSLPLVATNDVHYVTPDHAPLQDALFCLGQGISVRDGHPDRKSNAEYYLKSPAQMSQLFSDYPEAVAATEEIAARCNWELDLDTIHLPRFDAASIPDFTGDPDSPADRAAFLERLCRQALPRKYGLDSYPPSPQPRVGKGRGERGLGGEAPLCPLASRVSRHAAHPGGAASLRTAAERQLEHELAVINQRGLADYFLIVWDLVRFAESRGIRHTGRGSAADSIVCHLLDITQPEPLSNDLLFERFLNPERRDLPDIDLDFDTRRRDEVVAYVYRKYGAEHVAAVGTVNTFRARAAIRELGKVLGLSGGQISRVANNFAYVDLHHLPEMLEALPEARGVAGELAYEQTLLRLCEQVGGYPRHIAVHVGGLIISERPLTDLVPLQLANKGIVVAQYDKDDVEALGLLKMDLLGLRIHTAIEHCLSLLNRGARGPVGRGSANSDSQLVPRRSRAARTYPAGDFVAGTPPGTGGAWGPSRARLRRLPGRILRRGARNARPGSRRPNAGYRLLAPPAPGGVPARAAGRRGRSERPARLYRSSHSRRASRVARRVQEHRRGKALTLSRLPLDDPAAYALIRSTHTIGLFQLESPGQRNLQGRLLADKFEDIVAGISLFRPGPVQADMISPFISRRLGQEPVTYLHPALEPILERTYGVLIYQEQVMRVAAAIGGFSLGEADRLRKAMNFDSPTEAMQRLHDTFLEGARQQGIEETVAEQVFSQVAAFAAFGFNKAHAASFARISYETAYLKAHYPAEYFAGLLTAQPMGFYPPRTIAEEAKRMGIAILPPCVNRSEGDYTVERGVHARPHLLRSSQEGPDSPATQTRRGRIDVCSRLVRADRFYPARPEGSAQPTGRIGSVSRQTTARATYPAPPGLPFSVPSACPLPCKGRGSGGEASAIRCGLRFLRDMSGPALEQILAARAAGGPFLSLRDFLSRANPPYPVVENLILARAFEWTGQTIPQLLGLLAALRLTPLPPSPSRERGGKAGLTLDLEEPQLEISSRVSLGEEITPYQRLQLDLHLLGLSTDLSPFAPWVEMTARQGVIPTARLLEYPDKAKVKVAGIVVARARPPVRSGRTTLFLCLEDHTGLVDITIFSEAYQRYGEFLYTAPVLLAEGELTRRGERDVAVTVKRVQPLPMPKAREEAPVPAEELAEVYRQTGPGSYGS